MALVLLILIGAVVGWVASVITKRDQEQGWLANILVGLIGSFLGGALSSILTGRDLSSLTLDVTGVFWSIVGAVALCIVLNMVQHSRPIR